QHGVDEGIEAKSCLRAGTDRIGFVDFVGGSTWIGGCFNGSTLSSNAPLGRTGHCACTPRLASSCSLWPSWLPGGLLVESATRGELPLPHGRVWRLWAPSSSINSSATSFSGLAPM